jgi:hypothetical protein
LVLRTFDDWRPLFQAAQSGDVQATEDAFNELGALMSVAQQKAIRSAIEQFDLGRVETLIVQYTESLRSPPDK